MSNEEKEKWQRTHDAQGNEVSEGSPTSLANTKQKVDVDVSIDANTIKTLNNANEKIEHYQKLDNMFSTIKEKLINGLKEQGIEVTEDKITNMDDVESYSGILNDLRGKNSGRKEPAGAVPLNSQGGQGREREEGYDSHEAMVQDLMRKSKQGGAVGKEANEILNALWQRKVPRAIRANPDLTVVLNPDNVPLKTLLNREWKTRKKLGQEVEE